VLPRCGDFSALGAASLLASPRWPLEVGSFCSKGGGLGPDEDAIFESSVTAPEAAIDALHVEVVWSATEGCSRHPRVPLPRASRLGLVRVGGFDGVHGDLGVLKPSVAEGCCLVFS